MSKLFTILIDLKDKDPFILKRSEEALEIFAQDLSIFEFPSSIEQYRQAIASQLNQENSTGISCENLQTFLLYCLTQVDIVLSEALTRFLSDPSEEIDQNSTPLTALDFLLQPFENQQIYIPRYQQYYVDVRLEKGETLVWRYQLGCGQDVDFFAIFCASMFRSIKPHTIASTNSVDDDDEDIILGNSIESSQPILSSPTLLERKLSGSLDNYIKLGNHRKISTTTKTSTQSVPLPLPATTINGSNQASSDSNIVIVSQSSAIQNWGRQIPTVKSLISSPTELSPHITGSFKAEK